MPLAKSDQKESWEIDDTHIAGRELGTVDFLCHIRRKLLQLLPCSGLEIPNLAFLITFALMKEVEIIILFILYLIFLTQCRGILIGLVELIINCAGLDEVWEAQMHTYWAKMACIYWNFTINLVDRYSCL